MLVRVACVFLCSLFFIIEPMKRRRSFALRAVCLGVVALVGMGSFFQWRPFVHPCADSSGASVEIRAVVESLPEEKNGRWIVDLSSPALGDSSWCRVRVWSTRDIAKLRFHDNVVLFGIIERPKPFDGFSYPEYLKSHSVHFVVFDGVIVRDVSGDHGRTFRGVLLSFRSWLVARAREALPSPHVDVLLALALGVRSGLPSDIQEAFARSGASHLLAVSGLHMTLIADSCLRLLLAAGVPRKWTQIIVSVLIVLYVLLIGAPASAVRAGSMSILVFLVRFIGRPSDGLNALCVVAAFMACANPYVVLYDVSYQLSVAAMFGIMCIEGRAEAMLARVHVPNAFGVRSSLAMSFAASLFTFPLVLFHFRQFSFLSFISSILLIPLLPYIFFFGAIAVVLGQSCSFPVWGMIEFMLRTTEWLETFRFFIISL